MKTDLFIYKIYEKNSAIAFIELGTNVLGGNDSLSFNSLLDELISSGVKYFIVNLKRVEIMNSSGLGMLVGALSNIKKKNATLVLSTVPEKFKNLLSMTHLNQVFNIYESDEEAIEGC